MIFGQKDDLNSDEYTESMIKMMANLSTSDLGLSASGPGLFIFSTGSKKGFAKLVNLLGRWWCQGEWA